jgi:hypothetical protein
MLRFGFGIVCREIVAVDVFEHWSVRKFVRGPCT